MDVHFPIVVSGTFTNHEPVQFAGHQRFGQRFFSVLPYKFGRRLTVSQDGRQGPISSHIQDGAWIDCLDRLRRNVGFRCLLNSFSAP